MWTSEETPPNYTTHIAYILSYHIYIYRREGTQSAKKIFQHDFKGHNTRSKKNFTFPLAWTNRFKNSFIPWSIRKF